MREVFIGMICYIIGVVISFIVIRPDKTFKEGWKSYQKFLDGKNAYQKGFLAGWKAAFEVVEKEIVKK